MTELLLKRLKNAFLLTSELFESINEQNLSLKLKSLPSNTFGEQSWCIIGARESYLLALQLGKWSGFSCSLKNINNKSDVLEKFRSTSSTILTFLIENINLGINEEIIFNLLEHEVQHHGQLIRYVYGNKLEFPKSWKERYNV